MRNSFESVPKVPPMRSIEVDEVARRTLLQLFGDSQNVRQPYAFANMFDRGGLARLGFGYGVEDLPVGEEGKFEPQKNEIVLSVATYEALLCDERRAKFTFCHELGHAVMHGPFLRSALSARSPQKTYKRTSIPAYLDPEWQADRFAGTFLMPTALVRKCLRDGMSAQKIAQYFGTSLRASEVRIAIVSKELGFSH